MMYNFPYDNSRCILPGQWFLALSGDNFDGYAFLEDAAR